MIRLMWLPKGTLEPLPFYSVDGALRVAAQEDEPAAVWSGDNQLLATFDPDRPEPVRWYVPPVLVRHRRA